MTVSRSARIWGLIAGQAATRAGRVSAADACAVAVAAAGVTGAWLNAGSAGEAGHLISVTNEAAGLLAELQLTLGEGPCADARTTGGPVLVSDLGAMDADRRWPVFAPAACRAGAGAVFAFPLRIGAIWTGVLGLYRDQPGELSGSQYADALSLADAAILLLLDSQEPAGQLSESGTGGRLAELTVRRAEIDQATGMLTEQLGVGIAEAFVRLRAYAYAHDKRLSDLASDIVMRRLRLPADQDPSPDGHT